MKRITPLIIVTVFICLVIQSCRIEKPVVRIGIIHSLTGTMAFSEKPLVEALMLAIEEINLKGGVLGHKVEAIVIDGKSDKNVFAKETERLILEEHVSAIFGCWTSACRKAVQPIVERHQNLLFYPLQYEGLEQSPSIVYTGATPNQQITPSITWALNHLGKRFFLIGSDYIFPRTANFFIKDLLRVKHAEVVAEHYLPLGSKEVAIIVDEIERLQPDVILNTINGDSNLAFFSALKKTIAIPVISYSIAEPEFAQIGSEIMEGHYAAWNYFQSIDRSENKAFIAKFKKRFGEKILISDPMEASYIGFHLWARAVEHAQSHDPQRVKSVIRTESFNAPEGVVAVDATNLHLWKIARIGQAQKNGQFNIIWESDAPIRPVPYPSYRSKKEWHKIAKALANLELAQ